MPGVPAPADLFGGGKERYHGRRLARAAQRAVVEVLGLRAEERVVIISNPDPEVFRVAQALHDAAREVGSEVLLLVQPTRNEGEWMDPGVLRVLEQDPEVVVTLLTDKLGLDPERMARPILGRYRHYIQYMIGEGRSRGFWSPGLTLKAFERLVDVDYATMRDEARALQELLAATEELHVTTPAGSQIVLPIDGAAATADDGDLRAPGKGGNLPCGEVLVPIRRVPAKADDGAENGTDSTGVGATGRLRLDGPVFLPAGVRIPREVIELEVENGLATKVGAGADAEAVRALFTDAARHADAAVRAGQLTRDEATVYAGNARRLAEIGFGLHPGAKVTGDRLVDDKARGAVHLVFGAAHDEVPPGAPVAMDALLMRADVVAVLADGSELRLVTGGRLESPLEVLASWRAATAVRGPSDNDPHGAPMDAGADPLLQP